MHRSKQAFTLLEVVISLGIIVLLTGFILVIGFGDPEKAVIEGTLDDLEQLILDTKSYCHVNQVDCVVRQEKRHQFTVTEFGSGKIVDQLEIPKQYKVEFKTKPENEWQDPNRQQAFNIFVGKSGLNTPAGILIRSNESRGELLFDPLTGNASRTFVLF